MVVDHELVLSLSKSLGLILVLFTFLYLSKRVFQRKSKLDSQLFIQISNRQVVGRNLELIKIRVENNSYLLAVGASQIICLDKKVINQEQNNLGEREILEGRPWILADQANSFSYLD